MAKTKHVKTKQTEFKTHEKKDGFFRSNFWKITAITVVMVFVLILVGGLMKLHRFKAEFTSATEAQLETARNLVISDLQSRGLNASEYNITIPDKIRKMGREADKTGVQRTLLPANARAGTSKNDYIIDMDAGIIVMHSQTDAYGWMAEQIGKERRCGGMNERQDRPGECEKMHETPGPERGWFGGWMGGWMPGSRQREQK